MKIRVPAIAACAAALMAAPVPANAQTEFYIGQIITVAFNFCPQNTVAANGQLLQINQNSALYALIGTTYGGNGTTTFAVPNMGSISKGATYCIVLVGVFPQRQ